AERSMNSNESARRAQIPRSLRRAWLERSHIERHKLGQGAGIRRPSERRPGCGIGDSWSRCPRFQFDCSKVQLSSDLVVFTSLFEQMRGASRCATVRVTSFSWVMTKAPKSLRRKQITGATRYSLSAHDWASNGCWHASVAWGVGTSEKGDLGSLG